MLELPFSTLMAGSVALILALALASLHIEAGVGLWPRQRTPRRLNSQGRKQLGLTSRQRLQKLKQAPPHYFEPRASSSTHSCQRNACTTHAREEPEKPAPAPPQTRDTPGAHAAMELAHAYIAEVSEDARPALDDISLRRDHLNTLALATKQLDLAVQLDPDAVLEITTDDDVDIRFTIAELQAEALLLEGMTHQTYDTKPRTTCFAARRRTRSRQSVSPLCSWCGPCRQHEPGRCG